MRAVSMVRRAARWIAFALCIVGGSTFADAQPAKVHRIGWLGLGSTPSSHDRSIGDFLQGLRDLGYAEGKDVTFEMHPGTGHAFANEENALGTHDPDAASTAWSKAVAFLHKHLA